MFNRITGLILRLSALAAFGVITCHAQGKVEDYQRAAKFIQENALRQVTLGDVTPHWIGESSRFWYRKQTPSGKEFILVEPVKSTKGPAFDHARLAAGLSKAAQREFKANELPFDTFDFAAEGKSIQFDLDQAHWTCMLTEYTCKRETVPENARYESKSPDGKWIAYVRNFNLYLRGITTGQEVQLTRDGEKNWDYATGLPSLRTMVTQGTQDVKQPPAVTWSPDSSKLVTYRIDSRNASTVCNSCRRIR